MRGIRSLAALPRALPGCLTATPTASASTRASFEPFPARPASLTAGKARITAVSSRSSPATASACVPFSTSSTPPTPPAASNGPAPSAAALSMLSAGGETFAERPVGYHLLLAPDIAGEAPAPGVPSTALPLIVYENPSSMVLHRVVSALLATQTLYWTVSTGAIVYSSAPVSFVMPAAIATVATACLAVHASTLKRMVKSVIVTNPDEPIYISTYAPFFGISSRAIPRSDLVGLDPRLPSTALATSKYLPLYAKGRKYPFVLEKKGMFDLTGVLNPILGFSPMTYERCAPSLPPSTAAAAASIPGAGAAAAPAAAAAAAPADKEF